MWGVSNHLNINSPKMFSVKTFTFIEFSCCILDLPVRLYRSSRERNLTTTDQVNKTMNQLNIIILRWIASELKRDIINKNEHRAWMLDCITHDLMTIIASTNRPELLVGFLPRMTTSDNEQEFKELFEAITIAHRKRHNEAVEALR